MEAQYEPKVITKSLHETWDRLSAAAAALDSKMPEAIQADTGQAAFLIDRAKRELVSMLGYANLDELLEAIWTYEATEQ